ncbi:MAG: YybH family protein [Terriglobia bacterium]
MRESDKQHDEQEVLAANEAFYRAVQTLDLKLMGGTWWHDEWVQCLHPGWPIVRGWEEVLQSWAEIFRSTGQLSISVSRSVVRVLGDAAWVSCLEQVTTALDGDFVSARVETTNIFARRQGRWKVVHHHTTPLPGSGLVEASQSVQ